MSPPPLSSFVGIVIGVVLFVRIFGMMADSSTADNMRLVRPEIGLLLVTAIGLPIELGRSAYLRRMQRSEA
jgi:hypothetical protein